MTNKRKRQHALATLTALMLTASCSRDLTVPPDPQPGRVTGRIVFAVPGRSDLRPAAGASVVLLGSSLGATANQAGTFALAPLEDAEGVLLFRYDADGDGVVDRQRTERLADWKTGRFKQVDMGDVALGENAAVRGRVLLADKPGAKSGLGGSAVFVPEGPFTAFTADDGSYALQNLPPGPLQVVVFRTGYAAKPLGTIELRPAEEFGARDLVLEVSTDLTPGSITGALAFSPAATGKGDSAVTAGTTTGSVNDDLSFRIEALPPALYTVAAARAGYTTAQVPNVLVLPGQATSVGVLLVTDQPAPDAGSPPPTPDAGPAPDAGTLDGGPCVGPQCTACLTNAQCALNEWCDSNFCAPQCSPSNPCSNGRACDSATKTCVVPCGDAGSCPGANEVCENNACRSACDVSFPCPAGQVCSATNACIPECSATSLCAAQHLTCVAGQCLPKTSCTNDLDCGPAQMCLVGTCKTRPTALTDAGVYPCTAPCHCRLGEWCVGGECQPDVEPTLWFAADGGGSGATRAAAAPASDFAAKLAGATAGTIFGLRADDRFYAAGGFTVPAPKVTIAGGFTNCGDDRWVRSDATRSVLASDAGVVVALQGTPAFPIASVALSNLKVQTATTAGCDDDAISAVDAVRFSVARVEGGLEATNDCSTTPGLSTSLISCVRCTDFDFDDVRLEDTATRKNQLVVIDLSASSGSVRALTVVPPSDTHAAFIGLRTDAQLGTVKIASSSFPEVTAGGAGTFGISASACGPRKLVVEGNNFSFARTLASANKAAGVFAVGCTAVDIHDNTFDGSALSAALYPFNAGVELNNAGGTIERNEFLLPHALNPVVVAGIIAGGTGNLLNVRDNTFTGGTGFSADGIRLTGFGSPLVFTGNVIDLGPGTNVRGALFNGPSVRASDNFARVVGTGVCGGYAVAFDLFDASGVFERNRLLASSGAVTRALASNGLTANQLELYSSHLWAGPAACNGESSALFLLDMGFGTYVAGNTLDVQATAATTALSQGLSCANGPLISAGNVIGSGGGATHRMVSATTATCITPASWTDNHLWLDHASPAASATDGVAYVVSTMPGVADPNGNLFDTNVSPFDPVQPLAPDGGVLPRHRPSAPHVVNHPPVLKQKDGSPLWLDLDRRPRDAGAGPDLGCCERY